MIDNSYFMLDGLRVQHILWTQRSSYIFLKKKKKKRSTYIMDTIYVASIVLMPWTRAKPTKKKLQKLQWYTVKLSERKSAFFT